MKAFVKMTRAQGLRMVTEAAELVASDGRCPGPTVRVVSTTSIRCRTASGNFWAVDVGETSATLRMEGGVWAVIDSLRSQVNLPRHGRLMIEESSVPDDVTSAVISAAMAMDVTLWRDEGYKAALAAHSRAVDNLREATALDAVLAYEDTLTERWAG